MGFNLVGLLIALAMLAPNAMLAIAPPVDGLPPAPDTPAYFTVLERVGQVGCLTLLFLTRDDGRHAIPDVWSLTLFVSIAVYWGLWARYLKMGRSVVQLFRPLGVVPVPMAVFPVLGFASAAGWIGSPWLAGATVVFATGHLTNSWRTMRLLA